MVELICSLLLVCVVLNLKYNEDYSFDKDGLMSPMAIGITYFGLITMSISTSGACLNPAIGLVQSIYQKIIADKYDEFLNFDVSLSTMWIYITAPLLGGILAGFLQILLSYAQSSIERKKTQLSQESLKLNDSKMK